MYGAIMGDIVGSKYEFSPIRSKDFPFVSQGCEFTDDTVMTIAVARALQKAQEKGNAGEQASFKTILVEKMQELGHRFPNESYGNRFMGWLNTSDPQPYNSFGNGSAMRVSPCGLFAVTLEEALELAKASAEVTHNHPEGVRGAQAVAACIFLAKTGASKEEIRAYVEENFYSSLKPVDDISIGYAFDETCQGSVPQSISCFLDANSYEDAVRNAVLLGGDADTMAAIAGSIAWRYYQPCEDIVERYHINEMLPEDFVETIEEFGKQCALRADEYAQTGNCASIPL